MTFQSVAGRRAANKARTRSALCEALFALIEETPLELVTAEQVADAAGVSRRTFFNYFPSVEAILAHGSEEILDEVRAALAGRPTAEPLTESIVAVVEDIFTVDRLDESVRVWRAIELSPAAARYALAVTSDQVVALAESWARERLAPPDRPLDALTVSVLTSAAMSAFEAARLDWLSRHNGRVNARSRRDFIETVRRAVALVAPAIDST